MSRRRIAGRSPGCVTGALILAAAFPGTLEGAPLTRGPLTSAQARATPQESLLARVDSLERRFVQAQRAAAVAAASRRTEVRSRMREIPTETLTVRGMRIVTRPEHAGEASEIFAEVVAAHFAGIESSSLAEWRFAYDVKTRAGRETLRLEGERVAHVVLESWAPRSDAVAMVRGAVAQAIVNDLAGSALATWADGDPFVSQDAAALYRTLASTPSRSLGACLQGSDASCLASTGLVSRPGILDDWYTPEERRAVVRSGTSPSHPSVSREAYEACTEGRDTAVCDALLSAIGTEGRWTPFPPAARRSLVRFALERGGRGAWARLVADPGASAGQALASAAGVELPTLVAEWRVRLESGRRSAYAGFGGSTSVALLWVLVFTALAARSTRWRVS